MNLREHHRDHRLDKAGWTHACDDLFRCFGVFFRDSVDPVLILAQDGEIMLASPAFERITGIPAAEFEAQRKRWEDFVHPQDLAALRDGLKRCASSQLGEHLEYRLKTRAGQWLWVEQSHSILHSDEGHPNGIMALARNVQRRKDQEEQLQKQELVRQDLEEHLRQSQKMKAVGVLAGGLAHDFNNVLSGILGFSRFLQNKAEPGTALHRDLGLIHASAEQAAALTRQLLSFARHRAFTLAPVDLNRLVADVLAVVQHSLATGVVVQKDLAEALPGLMGDVNQLTQMLMNLFLNASDAMAPAGGKLTVRTEYRTLNERERLLLAGIRKDACIVLSVADTGKGMSREVMAQIFTPFFTTKGKQKGVGLGLSIVYSIVQGHHGDILVDSEEGRGSCFRVYLPVIPVSMESAPQNESK